MCSDFSIVLGIRDGQTNLGVENRCNPVWDEVLLWLWFTFVALLIKINSQINVCLLEHKTI